MSETTTERWDVLIEVGRRFLTAQQYERAEEAYAAALRAAEPFGDDDPRLATTLNALARVYCRREKFFPAAALLHRLLGIKERALGREHPELGGVVTNLADMYARLGDTTQELALRERALEIRIRRGDDDHVVLATAHERIAQLRRRLADTNRRPARETGARPIAPAPFGAPPAPTSSPGRPAVAAPRAARPAGHVVPLTVAQVTAAAPRRMRPAPLAPPAPDVSPELRRQRQIPAPRGARSRLRMPPLPNRTRFVATVVAAASLVVIVAAKREPRPAVAAPKPVYSLAAEGTVAAGGAALSNDAVIEAGLTSLGLPRGESEQRASVAQPAAEHAMMRDEPPTASGSRAATQAQPATARAESRPPAGLPRISPDVNAVTRNIERSARARVDSISRIGGVRPPSFSRPTVPAKPEF